MSDRMSHALIDRARREALFHRHRRLAHWIANDLRRRVPDLRRVGADDADQIALLGLWEALGDFDPARGALSAHARWRIRSGLQAAALVAGCVRAPWTALKREVSFPRAVPYGDRPPALESPAPAPAVGDLLDALPPRHALAVRLCYLEGKTRREAGLALGVSKQRAGRIVQAAIRRLRVSLGVEG